MLTITQLEKQLFETNESNFTNHALAVFHYQYHHQKVYRQYADLLGVQPNAIQSIDDVPFMPISFFKTQIILDDDDTSGIDDRMLVFESSGTTGEVSSKHYIRHPTIYQHSFLNGFTHFFGDVKQYTILALLPSYIDRGNSSLVYMVDALMKESGKPNNGFYLSNHADLHTVLKQLEAKKEPTFLIGVTYALLDFAEKFPMPLKYVKIMETGGMKGRRKEEIRENVHAILKKAFGLDQIYSEYGMTELLSQAYSFRDGLFSCPPWMKICIRDRNDPLQVRKIGSGAINCIDLANLHSCSFIATEDIGEVLPDGDFYIHGRLDNTSLRGCSLMYTENKIE